MLAQGRAQPALCTLTSHIAPRAEKMRANPLFTRALAPSHAQRHPSLRVSSDGACPASDPSLDTSGFASDDMGARAIQRSASQGAAREQAQAHVALVDNVPLTCWLLPMLANT